MGRSTPGQEFLARRRAWNHLGRAGKRELEDLRGTPGSGHSTYIPMVAEKMTMPSTFMPSLVPGSDL